jgi:hypothetical protein
MAPSRAGLDTNDYGYDRDPISQFELNRGIRSWLPYGLRHAVQGRCPTHPVVQQHSGPVARLHNEDLGESRGREAA